MALTWGNITPKQFGEYTRVSSIEPSHFTSGTAYVAVNRYQLEDMAPYIWKTTDFGKSWTRLDNGLPATEFVRVVREDPVRKGLLYAGTERGVWVSFDDGAHWKSLRRNLPIVPVHDLAIKDGDLIAATHGRGFWILDDISPLRQMSEQTASASGASLQAEGCVARDLGKSGRGRRVAPGGRESSGWRADLLLDCRGASTRYRRHPRRASFVDTLVLERTGFDRQGRQHPRRQRDALPDRQRAPRAQRLVDEGRQAARHHEGRVRWRRGGQGRGGGEALAAACSACASCSGQAGAQSLRVESPLSRRAGFRRNDGHSHERADRARGSLLGAGARRAAGWIQRASC